VNTTRIGTPYITGPDQWDGDELHVDKWTTDPRRTVPDGCVFVTVKGAGVGTIFPGVPGAIGRDIYAFKPAAEVHDSFVRRALEFTVSEIKRNAAGDIPGLSKDHLLKHAVKLPPREEQKRIIAAIDNLFVLSKSARDHLVTPYGTLTLIQYDTEQEFERGNVAEGRRTLPICSEGFGDMTICDSETGIDPAHVAAFSSEPAQSRCQLILISLAQFSESGRGNVVA
jgi:hypothetical protein